jgi:DNA-binding MarR family transcriptional regulator
MKRTDQPRSARPEPVDCLIGIFTARRDLMESIRVRVMRDAPITVDEADLLVYLYGSIHLDWNDLPVDKEGFVPVDALRRTLVHDRGLFSRRVRKLLADGLIEGQEPARPRRSRRYVVGVRLTAKGAKVIRPVWDRYCQLAVRLLAGVSRGDWEAQIRANEAISRAIRELGPD